MTKSSNRRARAKRAERTGRGSRRELARQLGVAPSWIMKACKLGLISKAIGQDGKLDLELAMRELEASADPQFDHVRARFAEYRARRDGVERATADAAAAESRPATAPAAATPTARAGQDTQAGVAMMPSTAAAPGADGQGAGAASVAAADRAQRGDAAGAAVATVGQDPAAVNPAPATAGQADTASATPAAGEQPGDPGAEDMQDDAGPSHGNVASFQDHKARKEMFAAKSAELEYLAKAGELVGVGQVRKAAFQSGRVLREMLSRIPDRLAQVLAAETDPVQVHTVLAGEIEQVLSEYTAGINQRFVAPGNRGR